MIKYYTHPIKMAFRLAILTTHPIQYYAPFFQLLAKEEAISLKVFYSLGLTQNIVDRGFGKKISWDLPLLEGYAFEFLSNTANEKGSDRFSGIKNPEIIAKIQDFNPNVLLVYGWAYHGHLKAIKHFYSKLPIWFRGDSTLMNAQPIYKKLLRKLALTWVYRHIDRALYVGQRNKAYYKAFGLKDQQLSFVPHAIDNQRFAEDRKNEATSIRSSLGLTDASILILFAGKIEAVKNPLLLINAFVKSAKDNVHLLVVGNGELEEKAKLASKNNALIHFLPFQNQTQMPALYQACDLFCLPSVSETWGLAINEAMAAGKAILASDQVGCAPDLIEPNKNGLIFASNNLEDLTAALQLLTAGRSKLMEMGLQSRRIITKWSFEAQLMAIKKLIN